VLVSISLLQVEFPSTLSEKGFQLQKGAPLPSHRPKKMVLSQLMSELKCDIHVSKREHLVPIFISYDHFLVDLLYILISCLNCSVHFRVVGRGIVVLNLEFPTQFWHHLIIEIGIIVNNNPARQPVPTNQFFPYELCHYFSHHICVASGIHPLGKVINCH